MKIFHNLKGLIVELYEKEAETDSDLDNFNVYISAIACYGYSEREICAFCEACDLDIDEEDYDDDDEEFMDQSQIIYGSIELNRSVIKRLKASKF